LGGILLGVSICSFQFCCWFHSLYGLLVKRAAVYDFGYSELSPTTLDICLACASGCRRPTTARLPSPPRYRGGHRACWRGRPFGNSRLALATSTFSGPPLAKIFSSFMFFNILDVRRPFLHSLCSFIFLLRTNRFCNKRRPDDGWFVRAVVRHRACMGLYPVWTDGFCWCSGAVDNLQRATLRRTGWFSLHCCQTLCCRAP